MRKVLLCAAFAGAICVGGGTSYGAGFKVSEQGAKAMGMANAFSAQADDPSALYYNPAGIAFLPGLQVTAGATGIMVPQTEFNGTTPLSGNAPLDTGTTFVSENSRRDLFVTPTFYASYGFEQIPVTVGLGINAIYPLSKNWDDSSAFRNQVENASIKPINFQPTVAYRFDDWKLGVAAGLDVTYAIVSLQKMAYSPFIDPTHPAPPSGAYELGSLGLDGTATGIGYNLGMRWQPRKDLVLGAAYRSHVTLHVTGDANFLATTPTGLGAIGLAATAPFPYTRARATSSASTTITLPNTVDLAVAWLPTEQWTLEFDATRTGWSSFKFLQFKFDNPQMAAFNNQPDPRNWQDVWGYKFGTQYAIHPKLDLRAGYAYDETPVPDGTVDPILPDANRHNFALGLGYHNGTAALNISYMWVHFVKRSVDNQNMLTLRGANGSFESDAYLLGADVTVKF
jgi:long-chain fatty acid transport protein